MFGALVDEQASTVKLLRPLADLCPHFESLSLCAAGLARQLTAEALEIDALQALQAGCVSALRERWDIHAADSRLSRHGQGGQESPIDQCLEVTRHAQGQRAVADEQSQLNIAL